MKKSLVIVAAAFTVMAAIGQARAQAAPLFVYSVKYVCGLQTIPSTSFRPPAEPPVKPGNYATAINFHNYHLKGTDLRKKAVIAGRSRRFRGPDQPNHGPGHRPQPGADH